jgi:kynurenine formamidase
MTAQRDASFEDPRSLLADADVVDLSWPLADGDPVFPGQQGFTFTKLGDLDDPEIPLYYGCVQFMEHVGTHMDSPAHAIRGAKYLDELEFHELTGPAVKIDCRDRIADDPDADVTAADVERFEREFGPIAEGSVVFLHTGWDTRYASQDRYIVVADDDTWHWPGLAADAARLLVERGVRGVGMDTIGLDGGHVAMALEAHRAVLGSGAFILENVANLAALPPVGTTALALPMKTRRGSGAPTRVFALSRG